MMVVHSSCFKVVVHVVFPMTAAHRMTMLCPRPPDAACAESIMSMAFEIYVDCLVGLVQFALKQAKPHPARGLRETVANQNGRCHGGRGPSDPGNHLGGIHRLIR